MPIPNAHEVLARLREQAKTPFALAAVPRGSGIYALLDHEGQIRYIGKTVSPTTDFNERINDKHVTGSESRSHKFSHAYNTGRMWRSRKPHPLQDTRQGLRAKALRNYFCRRFCRAVVVPIDRMTSQAEFEAAMTLLERQVQRLAPEYMAWGDYRDFEPMPEPSDLVELAIAEGPFSVSDREAFLAQRDLYARLVAGRR